MLLVLLLINYLHEFLYSLPKMTVSCLIFISNLLSPDSILDSLFPGDYGVSPPNPTIHFQLTKVG